jgi:hypothetical protein
MNDNFSAKPNHVWQLPNPLLPAYPINGEPTNPLEFIYTETLQAGKEGIIAKNPFVFTHLKHPTKNCFVFYRRDIPNQSFPPDKLDPKQVERQEWMEKDEEDAHSEMEEKISDATAELDETLLELILGYQK